MLTFNERKAISGPLWQGEIKSLVKSLALTNNVGPVREHPVVSPIYIFRDASTRGNITQRPGDKMKIASPPFSPAVTKFYITRLEEAVAGRARSKIYVVGVARSPGDKTTGNSAAPALPTQRYRYAKLNRCYQWIRSARDIETIGPWTAILIFNLRRFLRKRILILLCRLSTCFSKYILGQCVSDIILLLDHGRVSLSGWNFKNFWKMDRGYRNEW